ncbi:MULTISPECIES: HpcH/HpaI aldolase/citrate lyase family protein [unclassified Moraxella]|uniref:HpcH/HpaI aldolase/citrate lyase family protein n=1 Tax=unclassified Moraxella TaxID=2685852 RepID=UPI003AF6D2B4
MSKIPQSRSYLFVPAIDIHRVPKAFERGADTVIIDLEDAVSESVKQQCQHNLQTYLTSDTAKPVWVRVNAVGSDWFAQDIELVKHLPNIIGIVLPKVETADDIAQVHCHFPNTPIIALIETPIGMANVADIATAQGLYALSYGFLDICEKLGVRADSDAGQMVANQLRYQLLLHSQINGLTAPIECVYPPFNDNDGLTERVKWWRDLGFSGMLCIHPNQVGIVNTLAKPTDEQLTFAKKVVAYYEQTGLSAFAIDGEMVDTPVIVQAQKLLQQHA